MPNLLQEGDSGPSVEALQMALRARGFFAAPVNGIFGPTTTVAVRAFNSRLNPVPENPDVADAVTLFSLGVNVRDYAGSEGSGLGFLGTWDKWISYFVCVWLCVFVAISAYYAIFDPDQSPRYLAITALIVLALAFGAWFVSCFTDDPSIAWRRRETFRFAYVFTMTSFAVLLFPVANPWQPDVSGPIGIIRGCVDKRADKSTPDSIACVVANSEGDVLLEPSAGGANSTTPNDQEITAGCAPPTASSSTAACGLKVASATIAQTSAATAALHDDAQNKITNDAPLKPTSNSPASAAGVDLANHYRMPPRFVQNKSFPWLIVIGGAYGAHAERASDAVQTADKGHQAQDNYRSFTIVQSGFVVPYYVLLLAFVGGAISLTRRIPEYQKQSEPHYVGTADAPRLDPFEIRENVIFEIMQLITAPFIAMVAFYAFAPATTAGGITVSFLSGFASGVILLQLRGLAEGLAPALTARISLPNASQLGTVTGKVLGPDGKPVSGVSVSVAGVTSIAPVKTDQEGGFVVQGVPVGVQHITAMGSGKTATGNVTVTASGSASLTILLA